MYYSYRKLFSIEVLHEYFLNGRCSDVEIIPSADCRAISNKINILHRSNDNQVSAFIKDNGDNEPYTNINGGKFYHANYNTTVFRFYLTLRNPLFFHYSNVNFSYSSKRKFYFSNLAKNNAIGVNNISSPIREYAAGTDYVPGDLVADPDTKNVFEAIRKNSATKKNKLTDTSVWAPKGLLHPPKNIADFSAGKTYNIGDFAKEPGTDNVYEAVTRHTALNNENLKDQSLWAFRGQGQLQYATDNDFVDSCYGTYIFNLAAPANSADITVYTFNFNADAPAYDVLVPFPKQIDVVFKNPATKVNIDLAGLTPGKYKIMVNKETKIVYYDPALNNSNILGVIEIFNHLSEKDSYSLLADNEKIKSIKYTLQFANRRVLWKYIRKDAKAKSISDTGSTGYIFDLKGEEFISVAPIPLSESAVKTLKLEFNSKDFSVFPLPNPGVKNLGKFVQNDYDYLCTEMQLNY